MGDDRHNMSAVRAQFRDVFQREPVAAFFAPGRINFIGEHIDYAGGTVLPAAIDRGILALVNGRDDGRLRLRSTSEEAGCDLSLSALPEAPEDLPTFWCSYCVGIARLLTDMPPGGADILFSSDLPAGAGLSSSAALEVLTGFILLHLSGRPPTTDSDRMALARLARQAENDFVGVPCGIMDQFAVALGREDCLIHLDTTSLDFQAIPFPSREAQLVVLNSNRPRQLHESAYGERLDECQAALRLIQIHRGAESPLADLALATEAELQHLHADPLLYRRALHIVSETARVHEVVRLLGRHAGGTGIDRRDADPRGDHRVNTDHEDAVLVNTARLTRLGEILNASHESLRCNYEVSSRELDILHEEAIGHEACYGERMTGAGFGGCGIALIRHGDDALASFSDHVSRRYRERAGIECDIFAVRPSAGVHQLW